MAAQHRLAAAILIKNALPRLLDRCNDRRSLPSERDYALRIKENLKTHILEALLNASELQWSSTIVLQVALSISRIARTDWPDSWVTLFPSLERLLIPVPSSAHSATLILRGGLVLEALLAELQSIRLPTHVLAFRKVCSRLLPFVLTQWAGCVGRVADALHAAQPNLSLPQQILNVIQSESRQLLQWLHCIEGCLSPALLCEEGVDLSSLPCHPFAWLLSALDTLATRFHALAGLGLTDFDDLSESLGVIAGVLASAVEHLGSALLASGTGPGIVSLCARLVSHASAAGSATHSASKLHVETALQTAHMSRELWCEPLTLQALALLSAVFEPPHAQGRDEKAQAAHSALQAAVLSEALVVNLFSKVVLGLCRLRDSDLEKWRAGPEEWLHDIESQREGVRCAAQTLLWHLLKRFPGPATRELVELSAQAHALSPPATPEPVEGSRAEAELLIKEAALYAAGLGSSDLCRELTQCVGPHGPQQWLQANVFPYVQAGGSSGELRALLRRRAVWALGQWVGSGTLRELISLSVCALAEALSDQHIVVRIEALAALRSLLDLNVPADVLLTVSERVLSGAFEVIGSARELETQKLALYTLTRLARALASNSSCLVRPTCARLPSLWNAPGVERSNVSRVHILDFLTQLTRMVEPAAAVGLFSSIWPLLSFLLAGRTQKSSLSTSFSVTPAPTSAADDASAYLSRPALTQWQACVASSAAGPDAATLLARFPDLLNRLASTSEHADVVFKLIQSYVLLGGPELLAANITQLGHALRAALPNICDGLLGPPPPSFGGLPDPNSSWRVATAVELLRTLDLLATLFPQAFPEEAVFGPVLSAFFSLTQGHLRAEAQPDPRVPTSVLVRDSVTLQHFYQLTARLFTQQPERMLGFVGTMPDSQQLLTRLIQAWLNPGRVWDVEGRRWRLEKRVRTFATCVCLGSAELSTDLVCRALPQLVRLSLTAESESVEAAGERKAEIFEQELARRSQLHLQDKLLAEPAFRSVRVFVSQQLQQHFAARRHSFDALSLQFAGDEVVRQFLFQTSG